MRLSDWGRGVYARSPKWLQRVAGPLLGAMPQHMRYGKTYWGLREQIRRSEWDAEFVRDYQLRHLRRLFTACAESRYYKKLFGKVYGGISSPETITFEDLRRLPVLDKERLREDPEAFLTEERGKVDEVSTSGSSGRPLKFYQDRDRGVKEWAFITHIWSRFGYEVNHRRAVLRGLYLADVDNRPWEYEAALRELRLSPFHLTPENMARFLALMRKYRADFIHGYPSAISILAAYAHKTRWKPYAELKGVLPISERLFTHQRHLISRAFGGVKIVPYYGMSEKSAIAGEVEGEEYVYEFEPLYGYTELVDDDGRPVTEIGAAGRIVSTGFISFCMPLLRYDLGDMATLVRLPDAGNCYRLRVRDIQSRWAQEFLVSGAGALISIAAINVHSPVYAKVREFQFYQDTPGMAVLKVVPMQGSAAADIVPLMDEMQAKIGKELKLRLEMTEELEMNSRGKRPFIDQRLQLPA